MHVVTLPIVLAKILTMIARRLGKADLRRTVLSPTDSNARN
jgi:hypothetical protein